MATTLDEEFRKTMREFGAGASVANERYCLNTVRIVSTNIDEDERIWTLTGAEAESRAKKFRLMGVCSLRAAAICDERAAEAREETLVSATLP